MIDMDSEEADKPAESVGPVETATDYVRSFAQGSVPFIGKMDAAIDTGFDKVLKTFGLINREPQSYATNEASQLEALRKSRERTGLAGKGLELAGSVASPMNFIPIPGGAAVPKSILGAAGKFGVQGGVAGAGQALASYGGETASSAMNKEDAAKAALLGGGVGGTLGAVGGGILGHAAKNKDKYLLQAAFPGQANLRSPGKAAGQVTPSGELDTALSIAKGGEAEGIIGGFNQGQKETLAKATTASSQIGAEGEALRKQLAMEAIQQGNPSFATADQVKTDILKGVTADLKKGGVRLVQPHLDALNEVNTLLSQGLGIKKYGKTFTGLSDLHNVYETVSDVLRGYRGDRDFANSIKGQILFKTERGLKDMFRKEAHKINPVLTKELRNSDQLYHITESLQTAAGKGLQAEVGSMPGGGLRGRIGGMVGNLLGVPFGTPGRVLGTLLGSRATQRGVMPNTLLHALRNADQLSRKSGMLGGLAQKTNAPSDSGDY